MRLRRYRTRKKINAMSNSRPSTEAVLMSPICLGESRGLPESLKGAGGAVALGVVIGGEIVERTDVLVTTAVTRVVLVSKVVFGTEVVVRTVVLVPVLVASEDFPITTNDPFCPIVEPLSDARMDDCGSMVEHSVVMMNFIVVVSHGAVETGTTVGVGSASTNTPHQGALEISGEGRNANGPTAGTICRGELSGTVDCAETSGPAAVVMAVCGETGEKGIGAKFEG